MKSLLKKITDKIYYLPAEEETDRPILAAVVGENKTLLIDAGNSAAHANLFLAELNKMGLPRPDFVVLTHWHWDHIFGLDAIDALSIANQKTQEKIAELKTYEWTEVALDQRVSDKIEIPFCAEMMKKEYENLTDIKIVSADIIFNKKITIDLGGVSCIIENIGGDHAADSNLIYVEEEKIIFLGDCLAPDLYADKWTYTIAKLIPMLARIESYDFEINVESHWKPVRRKEFLSEARDLRQIAKLVKNKEKDIEMIKAELAKKLNRKLTADDHEMIKYFLNGLE